jgi:hypothetical protein
VNASLRIVAIGCGLALALAAASAETVFRCGSSYSHAPCEGATTVDVGAPVGAAQRAEAHAVAARERQLAAELVRDRRERERALRPATAGSLSAAPAAASASAPARKHARAAKKRHDSVDERRDFVAVVPTSTSRK